MRIDDPCPTCATGRIQVIQNVCELPDYNSPDDQPDLLQCTVSELEACVLNAFEHFGSPPSGGEKL